MTRRFCRTLLCFLGVGLASTRTAAGQTAKKSPPHVAAKTPPAPTGPTTLSTEFCPSIELAIPSYGNLPDVGRSPKSPLKADGMRIDPPMSVPKPPGDPPRAINAPSPPELPPHDR